MATQRKKTRARRKHERAQRNEGRRTTFWGNVRSNFLTGIIVVAPVAVTFYLIWSAIGIIDGWVLPLVPQKYQPSDYLGVNIKGYGVVIFLIFTVIVGALTKGLLGRSILRWGEGIVDRMPVVRSLYNGIKQIAETVLNKSNSSFERACLVEYPRKGIWAVAFVSTDTKGEILEKVEGDAHFYSIFLPTTPNPTSGFLLFVPEEDIILLDMDVESAAKLVISAGLINPPSKEELLSLAAQDSNAQ